MNKLRVVFIGCVQFSLALLEELLSHPNVEVCGVVTRQNSTVNADFVDLTDIAGAHNIPVFHATGNKQDDMASWIQAIDANICFCFGWSYLLNNSVLTSCPQGVVGYHPALLPRNRGRHPIIWALVLGLQETGSTFFFMDNGADSGPIISQRRVSIDQNDDAGSLYVKLVETAKRQLLQLVSEFNKNDIIATPQDPAAATYWRKRNRLDGAIDWRMPAVGVRNLVRALAAPYPGAHFIFQGEEMKVWKTRLSDTSTFDIEPGCILDISGPEIQVQCGVGIIILEHYDFAGIQNTGLQPGGYL